MTNSENLAGSGNQNQFQVSRIQYLSWKQFNGSLHIESKSGQEWDLFFSQGKLIWVIGGVHPQRRWQRQLLQHCPEVTMQNLRFRETEGIRCKQYHALTILVKRQQINQKQAISLITDIIGEALFDIIQQTLVQPLSYVINQEDNLKSPLTLIDTEVVLKQANESWESWRAAGLAKVSLNLAPLLRQPEQLQQETSAAVYQSFVILLNGNSTLRDLAIQMKQDLLLLTRSLIPYIRKGIIGLVEVEDLPQLMDEIITAKNLNPIPRETTESRRPLIACVDDSPQTCLMMEQIFKAAGYRFISIQNSVEALPTLLERKPDLVFLDLMMPVVNGYEICSQLRRVSIFANTPMIILTGSDGLIDRVRAKVVGASDFLTKPVDAQKVLSVVRKYVSEPAEGVTDSKFQLSHNS